MWSIGYSVFSQNSNSKASIGALTQGKKKEKEEKKKDNQYKHNKAMASPWPNWSPERQSSEQGEKI